MSSFTPGLRLNERFILTDRIGLGGMSEVWRATDTVLGRTVAVKALASPLATDPVLRAATWREARAAARLTHPNVVQIYDYSEAALPDGTVVPCLVMELVGGRSLADRLTAGPLPWPEATAVGAQVAAALAAAHRLGIVHRDVKPGNVMLTPGGAKVLDFGIAALAGAGGDAEWLVGTPAYAAPERLRPGPARPASDVYALGVLLHEMMTGRTPIGAHSWVDAEAAHRAGVPVPPLDPPGLPRRVAALARECLSVGPDDRPSAEQVAVALASAAELPDPTATLPPVDAAMPPVRDGYAVGSAALPQRPTMVEHTPLAAEPVATEQPAGRSRLLLVGVLGTVGALVLVAALVAAALRPGGTDSTAALSSPTTNGAASPSAASPSPSATAAGPQGRGEIVAALGRLIDAALNDGTLGGDAAHELRDRISELLRERGRGNVRKKADELQRKIDEMVKKGDLDPATGSRLIALLQPLTRKDG